MKEMGKRIKQKREELNMTCEDLGRKLGVNRSTISKYERGEIQQIKRSHVEELSKIPDREPEKVEVLQLDKRDLTKYEIIKQGNTYELVGDKIDEIIRGVNLDEPESFSYFQNRLRDEGVIDRLKKSGLKDGDYVRVKTFEFEHWE